MDLLTGWSVRQWLLRPMAAFCIALLSASLLCLEGGPHGGLRRIVSTYSALACAALGVLVIAQYVLGIDVGIDSVFCSTFHDDAKTIGIAPPGRMWPATAIGTTLQATALLLLNFDFKAPIRLHLFLSLASVYAIAPNLFGQAFGIAALCQPDSYAYSPLPASLFISFSAIGILLSRIESGSTEIIVRNSPGGIAIRRILTVLIAYPIVLNCLKLASQSLELLSSELWTIILCFAILLPLPSTVWKACQLLDELESERQQLMKSKKAQETFQEELSEQLQLSNLSAEVARSMVRAATLRELLQLCAEAMVAHLDLAFARIWTVDESGTVLILQASAGLYTHINGAHARIEVGQYKVGLIALEQKPHLTNDVQNDPRVSDREWAAREGMVAFAGYPLIVGDRLVGVLGTFANHQLKDSILAALASVSDVVSLGIQRKLAEQTHASSQALIQSSGDAIIGRDITGHINQWNPAAERIFGFSAPEILGESIEFFVPESKMTEFHQLHAMLNELSSSVDYEMQWKSRHKGLVELSITESVITDEGGKESGISIIARDISERKQKEELLKSQYAALEAKTEELQCVIDAMAKFLEGKSWQEAVATLLHGALIQTQSAYGFVADLQEDGELEMLAEEESIYGSSNCREYIGNILRQYNYGNYTEGGASENLIGAVITSGAIAIVNNPSADNGSESQVGLHNFIGIPFLENSNVIGMIGLAKSPDLYSEAEMKRIDVLIQTASVLYQGYKRHALEEKAERTETQLRLMQEREDFMFTLTHDMKNPLIGANRILEQIAAGEFGPVVDEQAGTLIKLRDSNAKLIDLIQNIVEVYRYERDVRTLTHSEVDLGKMVAECADGFENIAANRRITINLNRPDAAMEVLADANSIRRALQNLIENAIKYSPEGGSVALTVYQEAATIIIEVHNSGEAISKDDQQFLFQRFWQGIRGKRYVAGSGLGLYLCHKIVTANNGTITCSSSDSLGTTFTVRLPALRS